MDSPNQWKEDAQMDRIGQTCLIGKLVQRDEVRVPKDRRDRQVETGTCTGRGMETETNPRTGETAAVTGNATGFGGRTETTDVNLTTVK